MFTEGGEVNSSITPELLLLDNSIADHQKIVLAAQEEGSPPMRCQIEGQTNSKLLKEL